jgi:hypothetical protein
MLVNILGLTGVQISTIALILSFLGMAVGLAIWHQTDNKSYSDVPRVVQVLGFVVIVALFAASMGWWTPAIVLCVITILLMVISLRFAMA